MKFKVSYGWKVKSVVLLVITGIWVFNSLAILGGIKWFTPIAIIVTISAFLSIGKQVIVNEHYMIYVSPLFIKRKYLFKNIEKVVIKTEYTDRYEIDRVIIYHVKWGRLFTISMMYKHIGKLLKHCERSGVQIIDNRFNILE